MKAMNEAGYTFDFEKKELKKVEYDSENYKQQVMSEMTDLVKDYIIQKPAWSEEDERMYQSIIDDTVQENQLDIKQIDWLKSLRFQKKWKPSNEQMEALKTSYLYWMGMTKEVPYTKGLESLYEQLKKL